MRLKIAIIGECMLELAVNQNETQRGFGGDTLNTAVYLNRLLARQLAADQFEVQYVTALGDDCFSEQMLQSWQQEHLKTDLVQRLVGKLPGLYTIVTDACGERSFYYWRNEAAARDWLKTAASSAITTELAQYDYLYLSGISIAILDDASFNKLLDVLRAVKANGGKVIFDNNYRPRLWQSVEQAQQAYRQVLALTDIVFLTLDDELLLWGDEPLAEVIKRTRDWGVDEIVVKRGAQSCIIDASGQRYEVPANLIAKAQIVDTTAAGDSFSAGYLAARLLGKRPEQAAEQGHKLAGTVIQHRGAIISPQLMPSE